MIKPEVQVFYLYERKTTNLEESVGKLGSVVTDYQYEQNSYSDSHFLQDSVNRSEKHQETVKLVTDGGYGEDGTKLLKCAGGHKYEFSCYTNYTTYNIKLQLCKLTTAKQHIIH